MIWMRSRPTIFWSLCVATLGGIICIFLINSCLLHSELLCLCIVKLQMKVASFDLHCWRHACEAFNILFVLLLSAYHSLSRIMMFWSSDCFPSLIDHWKIEPLLIQSSCATGDDCTFLEPHTSILIWQSFYKYGVLFKSGYFWVPILYILTPSQ